LHIGSKNILSKADIGKLTIKELGGYKGKVEFISIDDDKTNALRPKQMWLNVDYAQKNMGFRMPILESEIKKILKNYARN
jgi:dTDP-4-dehydrorhamnose reductase